MILVLDDFAYISQAEFGIVFTPGYPKKLDSNSNKSLT